MKELSFMRLAGSILLFYIFKEVCNIQLIPQTYFTVRPVGIEPGHDHIDPVNVPDPDPVPAVSPFTLLPANKTHYLFTLPISFSHRLYYNTVPGMYKALRGLIIVSFVCLGQQHPVIIKGCSRYFFKFP